MRINKKIVTYIQSVSSNNLIYRVLKNSLIRWEMQHIRHFYAPPAIYESKASKDLKMEAAVSFYISIHITHSPSISEDIHTFEQNFSLSIESYFIPWKVASNRNIIYALACAPCAMTNYTDVTKFDNVGNCAERSVRKVDARCEDTKVKDTSGVLGGRVFHIPALSDGVLGETRSWSSYETTGGRCSWRPEKMRVLFLTV